MSFSATTIPEGEMVIGEASGAQGGDSVVEGLKPHAESTTISELINLQILLAAHLDPLVEQEQEHQRKQQSLKIETITESDGSSYSTWYSMEDFLDEINDTILDEMMLKIKLAIVYFLRASLFEEFLSKNPSDKEREQHFFDSEIVPKKNWYSEKLVDYYETDLTSSMLYETLPDLLEKTFRELTPSTPILVEILERHKDLVFQTLKELFPDIEMNFADK